MVNIHLIRSESEDGGVTMALFLLEFSVSV